MKNISTNKIQYYQFLNKLFPSKYSKEKIKNLKRQRLLSPINNDMSDNNLLEKCFDKNVNLIVNLQYFY